MVLSCSWTGKGKNAFENSPGFQAQNDDLRLKCRIPGENNGFVSIIKD